MCKREKNKEKGPFKILNQQDMRKEKQPSCHNLDSLQSI